MSTVVNRNVIDNLLADDKSKYLELVIMDDLEWNSATRVSHARVLQDKIYDYADAVKGQWGKKYEGYSVTVVIALRMSVSQYGLDFLNRMKNYLKENDGIELKWDHQPEGWNINWELPEGYQYEDGFSDEYVFDINKIYPRLRKNWAKKPDKEITVMPPSLKDAPETLPDMPMNRVFDSFVFCYVQDLGNVYGWLERSQVPEGVTQEELSKAASANLMRDVQYRMVQSNTPGVYGLVCGGDFEAESLLFPGLWQNIADGQGDDLVIAVPVKDLVFFAKGSDKKAVKNMLRMAENAFTNCRNSPQRSMLFCCDVFCYDRAARQLTVSRKLSLRC